MLVVSRRS
jgi:hypothetical protein